MDAPANGNVDFGHEPVPGTTAKYTCDPGYAFKEDGNGDLPPDTMLCLSSGEWRGSPPACREKVAFEDLPHRTEYKGNAYFCVGPAELTKGKAAHSWRGAQTHCEDEGGNLVRWDTQEGTCYVHTTL